MELIQWSYRPTLRDPILIAAFEGWNDAGDAATSTVSWFSDRWEGDEFAELDPDEFFDFTSTRPQVRSENGTRVIDWPANTFSAGTIPELDRDVILLAGTEPNYRWRAFCDAILEMASTLGCRQIVTLGALLAEVPHSRPIGIVGSSDDPVVETRHRLAKSTYEGPTGIVGVLSAAARDRGFETMSLWATVPSYVPGAPCAKATLALVRKTAAVLDAPVVTVDLDIASASYERQITELVDDDDETRAYVAALEAQHDERVEPDGEPIESLGDVEDADELIEEVERFLRESGD